jgi:hypothetical protein
VRSHLYVLQITQADVAIKRRVLQANGDAGFGGVMDKAYQEALKRIPEPKEKYDPWAVTKTPEFRSWSI